MCRLTPVKNKDSCCKTSLERSAFASPFVKEHVDVNVHLPQMFTEQLLNKLFCTITVMVSISLWIISSMDHADFAS